MHRANWPLLTVAGVVLLACDDGFQSEIARRGYILDDTVHIRIPASFRANAPDTVLVTTFGNGCVSFGYTSVTIDDLDATVEPYDLDMRLDPDFTNPARGPAVCNSVALEFVHAAELVFQRTGTATILVVGLVTPDSVVTVRRSVSVQ